MVSTQVYDDEHRTVYAIRIITHFTACVMIYTGKANHPFLKSTRRYLVGSFFSLLISWMLQEDQLLHTTSDHSFLITLSYKLAEAGVAIIVLLSCFLLLSVIKKKAYHVSTTFYVAITLQVLALLTTNAVKLGYLANAAVSVTAAAILKDFRLALEPQGPEASNVLSLFFLEIVLVVLNVTVFFLSLSYTVFGLKAAVYAMYTFRIVMFYLLVRPHLQEVPGQEAQVLPTLAA